ncbi:excitatory amino acid transporter 3 [Aricia agestis]|uniref:excitatory amino acid transporter 3 n=1 Tax=Aricia agestis TaxID=91739 RepID=UPI001C2071E2|nr:excitatory amino acid transporter 3 [Aricia agestis]XP_041984355.1 excitatory amino acid transporter 3 [Aricia agestis]XP_041984356.1 excitatory amino acid transporter 3 [Aricia agestis]
MPLQLRRCASFVRGNLLTMLTVLGVASGTLLGWSLRATGAQWSRREVMYFQYPGELFLRMLKCLIVPLLVSSIVSAIGSLDLSLSGRVGLRAIVYYMTTTVCAVMLGIALVTTIKPGNDPGAFSAPNATRKLVTKETLTSDTLLDLIRNVFPENIAQATIATYRTRLVYDPNDPRQVQGHIETYEIKGDYQSGTNVLGLVCFSILLGITLGKMGERSRPLQAFFHTLSEAMMIITGWVIWLSPLGVFFLVTAKIMEIESFGELVGRLGMYFMTVLLGLFLHGFGTLSILFVLATKKLPCRYIAKMGQVMATAFGTASSSATMPITIGCCDEMGLDPRITRFVIPIGATINMDGTALYEAVAAIFIAQLRKVDMSFGKIVAVSVTATAASIGAAGIPQAGLVTMVMVLDTVNLPAEDVSIILAVDWLLDRFRTTINVVCDALGAIIVTSLSQGDIDKSRAAPTAADRDAAPATELAELEKGDR